MKLALPAAALVFVSSSLCCCGDILGPLLERAGVPFDASLPGDPPDELSDLPVYPGAEYFAGASLGDMVTANWYVTGSAPGEIAEYYRGRLEADGWNIDSSVDLDELSSIEASRADERLDLSASVVEERVLVSVALEGAG